MPGPTEWRFSSEKLAGRPAGRPAGRRAIRYEGEGFEKNAKNVGPGTHSIIEAGI